MNKGASRSRTSTFPSTKLSIMTIGHSTRSVKEFIHLLKAHQVQRLVDIRTVPRSRHNPQFNRSELSSALHSARLHYTYMPGLGGFRRANPDSLNMGWRNLSFRGFRRLHADVGVPKKSRRSDRIRKDGTDRDHVR